jgi:hypothetical protein
MKRQTSKPSAQPTLASVEADLFGAIFEFHKKTMTLLRQASLNDEQRNVVADRIKTLLDNAIAEVKQTQQLHVRQRLEAAYGEVKRLVEELSGFPDGGKEG